MSSRIYFDDNGVNKEPNQFGADIYRFDFDYDGNLNESNNGISNALTKGKLKYTPYELGIPKK